MSDLSNNNQQHSEELEKKVQNEENVTSKKRFPSWVWVLIAIVVAVGGYWAVQLINQRQGATAGLPAEMSVAEVAQLDPEEYFILDVREQGEWDDAHMEWATLIPSGELSARLDEIPTDKKIVVVCQSGGRSAKGRDLLLEAGFPEVTSMTGGMNDWLSQDLPVVTGP